MIITDIRIRLRNNGKMKAVVSVTFDNSFDVHSIKIIKFSEQLFLSMPYKIINSHECKDIVHSINKKIKDMTESKAIPAYLITGKYNK